MNGGAGAARSQQVIYDQQFDLPAGGITRSGYRFDGWCTSARAPKNTGSNFLGGIPPGCYAPGATLKNVVGTAGGSMTYYAAWTHLTEFIHTPVQTVYMKVKSKVKVPFAAYNNTSSTAPVALSYTPRGKSAKITGQPRAVSLSKAYSLTVKAASKPGTTTLSIKSADGKTLNLSVIVLKKLKPAKKVKAHMGKRNLRVGQRSFIRIVFVPKAQYQVPNFAAAFSTKGLKGTKKKLVKAYKKALSVDKLGVVRAKAPTTGKVYKKQHNLAYLNFKYFKQKVQVIVGVK
jgi:DUF971 family protein